MKKVEQLIDCYRSEQMNLRQLESHIGSGELTADEREALIRETHYREPNNG